MPATVCLCLLGGTGESHLGPSGMLKGRGPDHTAGPKKGDRAGSLQGKEKKHSKLLFSTVNSNFIQIYPYSY